MQLSQRALALNEDLFQLLIDAVQDCAIYAVDPTGHVVTWNKGARVVKGYTAEEIIGQHFSRFYPPEDLAENKPDQELREALEHGRFEDEGWRVRKDGTRFWANVIITPLRDPRGRLRGFAKVTRDLTERRQNEERLVTERLARAQAESAAERTRALQAMADVASATLEPKKLAAVLAQKLRKLLNADFVALSLVDAEGRSFETVSSVGLRSIGTRVPWGEGLAGKLAAARQVLSFEDAAEANAASGELPPDARSAAGAPLAIADKVIGAVAVGTMTRRTFSKDELVLLEVAADRAAVAIEQARARRALEQSQARFRGTFEQAAVGIAHTSLEGNLLRVNRKLCEILGYAEQDLLRRSMPDITVADDDEADARLMGRLLAREIDTYSVERRCITADGATLWVNATVSLVRDQEDAPEYLLYVIEDIRERKRAEDALRESDVRFRQLADSMPQMVFSANASGEIDYHNQRWHDFAGDGDASEPVSFADMLHPEDRDRVIAAWQESVRSGRLYQTEHRLRDRSGHYRWFLGRAVGVRDGAERVERWFGSITDIDAQKAAQGALEEAVRVRDDFLSIASHELNTPLTPIKLQLATLLRPMAEGDPMSVRLRAIERQIDRLAKLVSELLDVSRISSGRLMLEIEPIDLVDVVRDVASRFAAESSRTGSRLVLHHPRRLVGPFDRMRIDQILSNLVSNAFKFGGGKPIEIELSSTDDRVHLEVRDGGIGIAPADQARIFDRFERTVSNRNFGGFGLGLWIVRQIVEALGGHVSVASRPGEGTAFKVVLPMTAVETEPRDAEPRDEGSGGAEPRDAEPRDEGSGGAEPLGRS